MPLRLKSLELHGYKTFAARTFFEFASGITAVVGPNGAGKSNIADALRWVLGEQSYSLLRGKKTEDMIFSGSEHRPRAGMASAEVIFDNSAGWLPLDFSEVAMTRRAYRDGHNDYLLNGQHVRLREMNELLAASGLSERTYTMVGQGLVDASLALKADERRRLFEEAAGVGLYRIRREEALRRLESTLRNLERVQDIMAEIEPRLKTLERQARRANEYATAQADLREVLREWYGYHWHRAQQELQEAQESVRLHQSRAQAAREALDRSQADHGQVRSRLAELRSQLSSWHRESAELHKERESVSRELAVLEERRRIASESIVGSTAERHSAANEELLARERLAELEQDLRRAESESGEAVLQLKAAQEALHSRQSGRGMLENALQAARDHVAGLSAQRSEKQARSDALQSNLEFQATRIASARRAVDDAEIATRAAEDALAQSSDRRSNSAKQLHEELARAEAARRIVGDKEAQWRAALDERSEHLAAQTRLQTQLDILEQAEKAWTGYAEGARFLLEAVRQSRLKARGALIALLDLPAELERAIAAALGDAVDTVLIDRDQIDEALELLEAEDAGRAVLMPLDGNSPLSLSPSSDPEAIGIASQLVQVPADLRPPIEALLGSTLIVRTRAAARRLLLSLPPHGRIVTLRGEVFRGDGLITAGRAASSATLSRPRQRRELADSLSEAVDRTARLNSDVEDRAADLRDATDQLLTNEGQLDSLRKRLLEDEAAEQQAILDAERQRRQVEWHAGRQEEFVRERAVAEEEQKQLAAAIAGFDASTDAASRDMRKLTDELNDLSLDEVQEQTTYWSTRAAVTEQAVVVIHQRMAEQELAQNKLANQMQAMASRMQQESTASEQLESERAALLESEHGLQQQIESLQALILPAEQELERSQLQEAGLEDVEVSTQRLSTNADRALAQYEIELVRRQEALDTLRTRIVDDFGLVSFEYAANIEGPVPLPFEGLVEQLPVVTSMAPDLEDQLSQRRARLRRLGLINPEAAKDYASESDRYSFLTAQVQDLRQADSDLRQVISELDELTRQEFSRTYAAVDKQFRSIFTRLFGGGAAHLSLTDPDNLIETGIEIDARLPGRREQGLSLLSGGERSLTAIALVLALLKVSPTPVCVLDEVDAMLDEANVGRFRDLLSELSQDTQFIIITHNRNTVQAADFIYGVTMGRDSTSQIISLRLDQVSPEMLGSGRA